MSENRFKMNDKIYTPIEVNGVYAIFEMTVYSISTISRELTCHWKYSDKYAVMCIPFSEAFKSKGEADSYAKFLTRGKRDKVIYFVKIQVPLIETSLITEKRYTVVAPSIGLEFDVVQSSSAVDMSQLKKTVKRRITDYVFLNCWQNGNVILSNPAVSYDDIEETGFVSVVEV